MSDYRQTLVRWPRRRMSYIAIQVSLLTGLAACSEAPHNLPTETQAISGPSQSAAELANDGMNTISFAQAVAAGVVAHPDAPPRINPDLGAANGATDGNDSTDESTVDEGNAQTPGTEGSGTENPGSGGTTAGDNDTDREPGRPVVNPLAPIPPAEAPPVHESDVTDSAIVGETPKDSPSVTETPASNPSDTTDNPVTGGDDSTDSGTDSGTGGSTGSSTGSSTGGSTGSSTGGSTDGTTGGTGDSNGQQNPETDSDNVSEQPLVSEPDPVETPSVDTDVSSPPVEESNLAATQFSSHTTPGFEGEVMQDAIRISWLVDPGARGYNVYKQAEYITTVFTNEYIDEDVFDEDYYYEIQAFDYDDTLYYIATGLTVSARTLGKVNPDASAPNTDLLNDYELVFSDEFNGSSLDLSKWDTSYIWGPELIINSEEQYYVDIQNQPDFGFNPFSFDGNNLIISSIKTPADLSAKALNQPYLSGVITSYDAFKFTYGYIETRAKMTYGKGYWPAFWLLNAYYVDDKPEIDIMEFIGDNQDVVYHTYHYYDSTGQLRSTKSQPTPGIDYTEDFHTFAVEWKPNTIIFYIDGIERHRVTDAKVSQQEMYVIANTALGGWWAGSPDEYTPFPGKFTLDYIRVYQKNTPYDDVLLDDGIASIPYADDIPGQASPNHRPTREQWPQGYPDGL